MASTSAVARNMIVSGGDAIAVGMLTGAVPGIRIGYDPCSDEALEALKTSRDFAGFVRDALTASPDAELIYLAWRPVIELDKAGFDIIGAFRAAGKRVDVWSSETADAGARPVVERLMALGADQITTDDPEGLLALIGDEP